MGGVKKSDKKNNLSHKITIQDSKGQEGLEKKSKKSGISKKPSTKTQEVLRPKPTASVSWNSRTAGLSLGTA